MRRVLVRSPAFVRAAKRIIRKRPAAREAIRDALALLEADAFHPRLRTHKLKGELANCPSATAGYDLRIVFEFVQQPAGEAILLLTAGTHDEVY